MTYVKIPDRITPVIHYTRTALYHIISALLLFSYNSNSTIVEHQRPTLKAPAASLRTSALNSAGSMSFSIKYQSSCQMPEQLSIIRVNLGQR